MTLRAAIFPHFLLILTTITGVLCSTNNGATGGDLDNAVVGSPTVQCEREFIHFSVPTKKPFRGRIYIKGEYSNSECVRIYDLTEDEERQNAEVHRNEVSSRKNQARDEATESPKLFNQARSGFENYEHGSWRDFLRGDKLEKNSNGKNVGEEKCPLVCPPCQSEALRSRRQTGSQSADIDVRLGTCNVQRDRTLSPPGLRQSAVIVVSFHHSFVTKVDRAYRVDCLYEESNKQVTTKIDVSMPPTVELSSEMQSPRCDYRIKSQSGADLKNVRVGEEALHEWTCAPANSIGQSNDAAMNNMFAMLVHSCFVDDGQGIKQMVVDGHGCSMDEFIMPSIKYSPERLKASVSAPVVKFPDRDVVGFQCAISVFMKEMGNTPPKCDGPRTNRTRRAAVEKNAWQLHNRLTVFDPETSTEERDDLDKLLNEQLLSGPLDKNVVEFCVSVAAFGLLIASSTFLFTVTAGFVTANLLLRREAIEKLIRQGSS